MHEGRLRFGWKVTTSNGRSAIQCADRGEVYYRRGKKTIPRSNCGPLTVFRSRKAAKSFKNKMSRTFKINRCVYFVSKEKKVWVEQYIKTSLMSLYTMNKDCIPDPKSVALADWVMLIPKE